MSVQSLVMLLLKQPAQIGFMFPGSPRYERVYDSKTHGASLKPPNSSEMLASIVATMVVSMSDRNKPTPMLNSHSKVSVLPGVSPGLRNLELPRGGGGGAYLTRIMTSRHLAIGSRFRTNSSLACLSRGGGGASGSAASFEARGAIVDSAVSSILLILVKSSRGLPALCACAPGSFNFQISHTCRYCKMWAECGALDAGSR